MQSTHWKEWWLSAYELPAMQLRLLLVLHGKLSYTRQMVCALSIASVQHLCQHHTCATCNDLNACNIHFGTSDSRYRLRHLFDWRIGIILQVFQIIQIWGRLEEMLRHDAYNPMRLIGNSTKLSCLGRLSIRAAARTWNNSRTLLRHRIHRQSDLQRRFFMSASINK